MCQHNLPCSIVLPTACFPEGPSPHFTFCSFWRRRPRLEAVVAEQAFLSPTRSETLKTSFLAMAPIFFFQNDCNPETCTQMTATEQWIFLCAAHKTPKEVKPLIWINFYHKIVNIFLSISFYMCFGCSKEPSP